MTPRASILLALVTAPVAALRYARTVLARVLFAVGDGLMRASWWVTPEDPPVSRRAARPAIMLVCEVCGTRRAMAEWGLGWQTDSDRGGEI